jgi:GT2 family glycosyltransferase
LGGVLPPYLRVRLGALRYAWRGRQSAHVERAYPAWLRQETPGVCVSDGPLISVLLPVHNPPAGLLRAAMASVATQTYRNWELCVADDASAPDFSALVAQHASSDPRIRVVRLRKNAGIAAATNAALGIAQGALVALLDHDDLLAPHALSRVAGTLAESPDLGMIFSDEDQLIGGRRCRPYFKPGWNPDLMLGQNLVSHLGVYRRSLIDQIGGLRTGFDGSQDYDLALRASAAIPPGQIRHIPEILYHWRQHRAAFSSRKLAACRASALAALAERLGPDEHPEPAPDQPLWTRIAFAIPAPAPLLSLIVPETAGAASDPLYPMAEVVKDAAAARGQVLVFLAPDLVPAAPGWLRELAGQALRPEIACAGGRVDQPSGCVAEAGFTLHPDEIVQSLRATDPDDPGYLGQFQLARSVSAVSRACLAIRADLFREAGGFDPRAGLYADADLCLRLAGKGMRCVWTPHARLRYRERIGRARPDTTGAAYMRQRWGETLARDPYANPNLVIRAGTLGLADRQPHPPQRHATQ